MSISSIDTAGMTAPNTATIEGSSVAISLEDATTTGGIGDLYIVIHVKKHPKFNRRGLDLHMIKEITFPEASIGTKTEVITLDGGIERLKIPEGTQNGEIFKIRGRGMSSLRGRGQGDLYVEIQIKTPKRLSRKARKLLEELNDELKD